MADARTPANPTAPWKHAPCQADECSRPGRRLLGQIETQLQKLGKAEVPSRIVGDLVIAALKELDQIAYIRYAIVYLGLDDLHSLRNEIDRLLEG